MKIRIGILFIIILCIGGCVVSDGECSLPRQVLNMNTHWEFAIEDTPEENSVRADSASEGDLSGHAFDGDAGTIWHTPWGAGAPGFPHWIQKDFGEERLIEAVHCLPRQHSTNGWIREYEIYISDDGVNWGEPIFKGEFSRDKALKKVKLLKSLTARYIRLKAISGFTEDPFASLAELKVLPDIQSQEADSGKSSLDALSKLEWQGVHLPHTPRVEPKEFGTHWQGVCWYRRRFYAVPEWQDKKILIQFEAVMQRARVWVNGKEVLTHDGGFLPFCVDVSDLLLFDGTSENVIVVQADNRDMPDVPPGRYLRGLDMTYQGGIYRDVNMIITDKLHITDAVAANQTGGGGLFVTYPEVSKEKAMVQIKTHVENLHDSTRTCRVEWKLFDSDGKLVAKNVGRSELLEAGENRHFSGQLVVKTPNLWHPNSPYLYDLVTSVIHGETVVDVKGIRIGIRHIEWRNEGFFINGERLLLNGANRHQDGIYVGNALPDNVQWLDAKKLREAGFNNVRAGHYPLDTAFMEACDEYGLTVIACIPGWHWYKDSDAFKNNSYRDVRDLIRRDRNHPSVILYETILNETGYSAEYARETYRISKEEDPQSFAACDYNYPEYRMYDVNYKVPDSSKPAFTREWGDDNRYCGIHRGRDGFTWGDWANRDDEHSMVYQSLARQKDLNGDGYWDWYGVNANPTMAGYALWVGFDHNRGATSNIARCGVWGLDRYEKFCHYFLQSQRDPAIRLNGLDSGPMVFIASFWRPSSLKDVNVYSNCETVKLYLNDRLIGTQSPDKTYNEGRGEVPVDHVDHPMFTFKNLTWQAGTLQAEGLIDGKVVARHQVRTPGKAEKLTFRMDCLNEQLVADGSDMAMLFIQAVDKNGTLVPDFSGEVAVDIEGCGRLIGANPVVMEGGVAAVWLRSTIRDGKIVVAADSPELGSFVFETGSREVDVLTVSGPFVAKPPKIRTIETGEVKAIKKVTRTKVAGVKVRVSSSRDGYSADSLTDGDRESWWYAGQNRDQWVEIALPKTMNLKGSLIVWEKDSTWYQFSIQVSKDGKQWRKVYEGSQTGHNFETEDWQADGIRFVKIVLSKVSPADSLLGIREIELYQ